MNYISFRPVSLVNVYAMTPLRRAVENADSNDISSNSNLQRYAIQFVMKQETATRTSATRTATNQASPISTNEKYKKRSSEIRNENTDSNRVKIIVQVHNSGK